MENRKRIIENNLKNNILQEESKIKYGENKIRIGTKILEGISIETNSYQKIDPIYGDKIEVLRAINEGSYTKLRKISNFFYRTSGIYSRLCKYIAYLYRYDWILTPYINSNSVNKDKLLKDFNKILSYLDNSELKKIFGDISLKVIKLGCYYGYLIDNKNKFTIQELPIDYCRSRFSLLGRPVVEFNMHFFDNYFPDKDEREKILKTFPEDIQNGYKKFRDKVLDKKENVVKLLNLSQDYEYLNISGWYTLDPKYAFKFNLDGEDYPSFISVIPSLIDLDDAKGLDRKKMQQELLKIIVQNLPFDKNGDAIFDTDEAIDMHNNAVQMLGKSIGLDVLTTYADVKVEDLTDNRAASSKDDLERSERGVFNEAGASQMLFNTNGNIALEKSILNDESGTFNIISQYESFLNYYILDNIFNKVPKYSFKLQMLPTTIYNYKELSKIYKELTSIGYSKMLPMVSLGYSQSAILSSVYFENEILNLSKLFIPPASSSTMNADSLKELTSDNKEQAGRPEKPNDEKAEKTILNEESK